MEGPTLKDSDLEFEIRISKNPLGDGLWTARAQLAFDYRPFAMATSHHIGQTIAELIPSIEQIHARWRDERSKIDAEKASAAQAAAAPLTVPLAEAKPIFDDFGNLIGKIHP